MIVALSQRSKVPPMSSAPEACESSFFCASDLRIIAKIPTMSASSNTRSWASKSNLRKMLPPIVELELPKTVSKVSIVADAPATPAASTS